MGRFSSFLSNSSDQLDDDEDRPGRYATFVQQQTASAYADPFDQDIKHDYGDGYDTATLDDIDDTFDAFNASESISAFEQDRHAKAMRDPVQQQHLEQYDFGGADDIDPIFSTDQDIKHDYGTPQERANRLERHVYDPLPAGAEGLVRGVTASAGHLEDALRVTLGLPVDHARVEADFSDTPEDVPGSAQRRQQFASQGLTSNVIDPEWYSSGEVLNFAGETVGQMAPMLAATIVSGPLGLLGMAGGAGLMAGYQQLGAKYGESINNGKSHEDAVDDALISALITGVASSGAAVAPGIGQAAAKTKWYQGTKSLRELFDEVSGTFSRNLLDLSTQSGIGASEQIGQNIADDVPWHQNVDDAALGEAMFGGAQIAASRLANLGNVDVETPTPSHQGIVQAGVDQAAIGDTGWRQGGAIQPDPSPAVTTEEIQPDPSPVVTTEDIQQLTELIETSTIDDANKTGLLNRAQSGDVQDYQRVRDAVEKRQLIESDAAITSLEADNERLEYGPSEAEAKAEAEDTDTQGDQQDSDTAKEETPEEAQDVLNKLDAIEQQIIAQGRSADEASTYRQLIEERSKVIARDTGGSLSRSEFLDTYAGFVDQDAFFNAAEGDVLTQLPGELLTPIAFDDLEQEKIQKKRQLTQKTSPVNAEKELEKTDRAFEEYGQDALRDPEAYQQWQLATRGLFIRNSKEPVMQSDDNPIASVPRTSIKKNVSKTEHRQFFTATHPQYYMDLFNDPSKTMDIYKGTQDVLDDDGQVLLPGKPGLSDKQISQAEGGLKFGDEVKQRFQSGAATEKDLTRFFLWSILSRGQPVYGHEAGAMLAARYGADDWIDRVADAADGTNSLPELQERLGLKKISMLTEEDWGMEWAGSLRTGDVNKRLKNYIEKNKLDKTAKKELENQIGDLIGRDHITYENHQRVKDLLPGVEGTPDKHWIWPEYRMWTKATLAGTPAAGVTANLNSFGEQFLPRMFAKFDHTDKSIKDANTPKDKDGTVPMTELLKAWQDPNNTGPDIRRVFHKVNRKAGVDNKIVSFTLLVTGHKDVLVLDRVQTRHGYGARKRSAIGEFSTDAIYDGYEKDRKTASKEQKKFDEGLTGVEPRPFGESSGFADESTGVPALAFYEMIEKSLKPKLIEGYRQGATEGLVSKDINEEEIIGRYHWESWVWDSSQEVGHGSLEGIARMAKGKSAEEAFEGVGIRQGRYQEGNLGLTYFTDENQQKFGIETADGNWWILDDKENPYEQISRDTFPDTFESAKTFRGKKYKKGDPHPLAGQEDYKEGKYHGLPRHRAYIEMLNAHRKGPDPKMVKGNVFPDKVKSAQTIDGKKYQKGDPHPLAGQPNVILFPDTFKSAQTFEGVEYKKGDAHPLAGQEDYISRQKATDKWLEKEQVLPIWDKEQMVSENITNWREDAETNRERLDELVRSIGRPASGREVTVLDRISGESDRLQRSRHESGLGGSEQPSGQRRPADVRDRVGDVSDVGAEADVGTVGQSGRDAVAEGPLYQQPQRPYWEADESKPESDNTIRVYHSAGAPIEQVIDDGPFGSGLFFGTSKGMGPALEHTNIYTIDLPRDEIIEASFLFYHPSAEQLDGLVSDVASEFKVSTSDAESLLNESKTIFDVTDDLEAIDGEAENNLQKYSGQAAKILGYRAVELNDENGAVWLVDMEGWRPKEAEGPLYQQPQENIDLEKLTKAQWSKVNAFMKKQGYDYRGASDAEKLFKSFSPSIVTEPGSVFRNALESATAPIAPEIAKAKKLWGTTGNWNETGYLLTDGSQLDFSLKREGGMPDSRSEDHRGISAVLGSDTIGFSAMDDFMGKGHIRVMPENASLEIHQPPTDMQKKKIVSFINSMKGGGYKGDYQGISVDFGSSLQNQTIDGNYIEYPPNTSTRKIIQDIDDKFAGRAPVPVSKLAAFRQKTPNAEPNAAIRFIRNDQGLIPKAVIGLFGNTNPSSIAHEFAHKVVSEMQSLKDPKGALVYREDLDILEQWAGVKQGKWTRRQHERVARGWERYLRTGKAPNERLAQVFAKLRDWMTQVYQEIKGSDINVKITPQVMGVYDRWLNADLPKRGEYSVVSPDPLLRERSLPYTLEESGRTGGDDRIYEVKSNQQTLDRAIDSIAKDNDTTLSVTKLLKTTKPSAERTAIGMVLLDRLNSQADELENDGKMDLADSKRTQAVEVATKMSTELTNAGQAIQAASMISRLSPEGVLLYATSKLNSLNEGRSERKKLSITTEELTRLQTLSEDLRRWEGTDESTQQMVTLVNRLESGDPMTRDDVGKLKAIQARIVEHIGTPQSKEPTADPDQKTITAKVRKYSDGLGDRFNTIEEQARKRLEDRGVLFQADTSTLPPQDIDDLSQIGASVLSRLPSNSKYEAWATAMIQATGEGIRPHLRGKANLYGNAKKIQRLETYNYRKARKHMARIDDLISKVQVHYNIREPEGSELAGPSFIRKTDPIDIQNTAESLSAAVGHLKTLTGNAQVELAQEINQTIDSFEPSSTGRKIATAQTAAMLLNPVTVSRNAVGNELFWRLERLSTMVAMGIDRVIPGENTILFKKAEPVFIENWLRGVRLAWKGIKPGEMMSDKFELDTGYTMAFEGAMGQTLEKMLGVALQSFDLAAWSRASVTHLHESAALAAERENIPPEQQKAWIRNWLINAPEAATEAAKKYGEYVTFQDESNLSNMAVGLKRALNANRDFGAGDLLIKFAKTPANLAARAIEYSPAGFAKSVGHALQGLKEKDQGHRRQAILSLSRALVGTGGLSILGAVLYDAGALTGPQEEDYDAREFMANTQNIRAYQVNVSALGRYLTSLDSEHAKPRNGDIQYSTNWAAPIVFNLASGANVMAAINNIQAKARAKGKSEKFLDNLQTIGVEGFKGAIQAFADHPLSGFIKDLKYGPENLMRNTITGLPASFVPSLVNNMRKITDPVRRETRDDQIVNTMINRVVDKIPFLSTTLPARYKTLGEEPSLKLPGGVGLRALQALISPGYISTYKTDDIIELFIRPHREHGATKQFPRVPKKSITVDKVKYNLSNDQRSWVQKTMGRITLQQINKIKQQLNAPANQGAEQQVKLLYQALNRAAKETRAAFKAEYVTSG